MRFSSKTFKRSTRSLKKGKKTRKVKKQKQRGGSAGSSLYRDIPKEATFSDVKADGLE
jgi:hypothetical protein